MIHVSNDNEPSRAASFCLDNQVIGPGTPVGIAECREPLEPLLQQSISLDSFLSNGSQPQYRRQWYEKWRHQTHRNICVTDSDICNVRRIIRFLTHVDKERFYSGRVRKSFGDYDDAKCDLWFLLDVILAEYEYLCEFKFLWL